MKLLMGLFTALFCLTSWAQTYPSRPIKIVTSMSVASGPDVQLRRVADLLGEKLRVPVIVENRPGAGGSIAISHFDKQFAADGYTIGYFDAGSIIAYPTLYERPELVANIEPVVTHLTAPYFLAVSTKVKNFSELQKLIETNNNYGSWAVGSGGHLAGGEFGLLFRNDMVHVPYKEYVSWLTDVAGQRVAYGFVTAGSSKAMYDAGKLHYLAVLDHARDPSFPMIPTVEELTGKRIPPSISWCTFYVHKNVPAPVKKQIETALRQVLQDPRAQEFLQRADYTSLANLNSVEIKRLVDRDTENFKRSVKKLKIEIKEK
jgi:tripartite-type tricarboxylate transporter receptor subunit TctC